MVRARDRIDRERASRDGLYGCRNCGTYHRLKKGAPLNCGRCKTAIVLVWIDPPASAPHAEAAEAGKSGSAGLPAVG